MTREEVAEDFLERAEIADIDAERFDRRDYPYYRLKSFMNRKKAREMLKDIESEDS